MAKQQKPRVNLPPLKQVCIGVKDMDRAIDYYSYTFGCGTFHVHEVESKEFIYRNQPTSCRVKIAITQSGPIEVELFQVLDGEKSLVDFLAGKGEGIQHLGFLVDDLDGMLAELAKDGIKPVFSGKFPGAAFAFLNTNEMGDTMFELMSRTEDGLTH